MFVRKKVNKSGSTSVVIVEKTRSRQQRVVRNFGSSKDTAVIQRLERQAEDYIIAHTMPRLPFVNSQELHLHEFLHSLTNSQVQVIGPELIFGELYNRIGYNAIKDEMFRHLVVCRLYNPGSKLKTVDYLERYLHQRYSVDKIYRFLDNLCYKKDEGSEQSKKQKKIDIKSQVEQISFNHTQSVVGGAITVCFYDMTTLYFEASSEEDIKRCGFSKDGKHSCPQIFLGLLVASGGNPIGYDIFEGNIAESKTIIPMIRKLADKFGFDKPIIVADAGLLTKNNIAQLDADGYQYILGARVKNETDAIKNQILSFTWQNGDIRTIKKDNYTRLIVSYTDKRAGKDAFNRQRGLSRLEKRIKSGNLTKENINNRGYNKYLRMEGVVTVSIDRQKFEDDAKWDGIKGFVTNTQLSESEVLANYSHLWYIERAFRMNKYDLAVRPIYHRLIHRIEGHICICFTAYTIMLELERLLKAAESALTVYRAQELTKNMYAINYELPKSNLRERVMLGMDDEQRELYNIIFPHNC